MTSTHDTASPGRKVSYRSMREGSAEDYQLMRSYVPPNDLSRDIALDLLKQLRGDAGPLLVNRYIHSLQTATRALHDQVEEELVVAALLHDIGEVAAPFNHAAASAEILQPFVSDRTYQVVRHHALFQSFYYAHHFGGDRNARDAFRAEPWFTDCVEFCERWDQASFDPDFETHPLKRFMPLVDSVFARQPHVAARSPIVMFD